MRRSLVLLFLVACGGVDIGDFQSESLDARCEYLTRCGLFPDKAACVAHFKASSAQSTSIVAAVDAGKVKYDDGLADDCISALRDASCSQVAQLDSSCEHIFTGTVADGGMCAFDDECVSGSCNVSDCTMACCPGTCVAARPVPKIGEACTFVCADGGYCADDRTCHATLPLGAACNDPFACTNAYCAGLTGQMAGTCSKLPATGEACTSQCGSIGDYCDGTCKKVGLPGDPCTSEEQCSHFYHCDDATMKCVEEPAPTLMPNGAMCTSSVQCMSHYCGNDDKCADLPVCI